MVLAVRPKREPFESSLAATLCPAGPFHVVLWEWVPEIIDARCGRGSN